VTKSDFLPNYYYNAGYATHVIVMQQFAIAYRPSISVMVASFME
jgi:hypothetical protein